MFVVVLEVASCSPFATEPFVAQDVRREQDLSSSWNGRPFGHNRRGPKIGGGCKYVPI